ncbi:MAG: DUF4129 domain-containing protein [Acidobacteriota bacterium]
MDLEQMAIRLRPRHRLEAADLGLALVRERFAAVFLPWLAVAGTAAVVLVGTLGFWGYALFWWLLPLWECVPLFALSRSVFGATPTFRQSLRATPGLWRRALPELFLRRFGPARSFSLPVGQLEGLRGSARRNRLAVLGYGLDAAAGLTIFFLILQLFLFCALIALVMMMTPEWAEIDWGVTFEQLFEGELGSPATRLILLTLATSILILNPFYVGSGFALYLDRRTQLEGWDLQIAFQRLGRRLGPRPSPAEGGARPAEAGAGSADAGTRSWVWWLLPLTLGLQLAAAEPAAAQIGSPNESRLTHEIPRRPWAGDPERDPGTVIQEVYEAPELQRQSTVRRWRLREDLRPDDDGAASSGPPEWVTALIGGLAAIGEVLVWIVGLGLLAVVALAAFRLMGRGDGDRGKDTGAPAQILGLDLRPESLPDDVPAASRELWLAGRHVEALSLLYRGALARLAASGVELRESFTEDDCLRATRTVSPRERAEVFERLTRAWQRAAYAHRLPDDDGAQQLWTAWPDAFGAEP